MSQQVSSPFDTPGELDPEIAAFGFLTCTCSMPDVTSIVNNESHTISTELGMRPLMERVLSRREILGA